MNILLFPSDISICNRVKLGLGLSGVTIHRNARNGATDVVAGTDATDTTTDEASDRRVDTQSFIINIKFIYFIYLIRSVSAYLPRNSLRKKTHRTKQYNVQCEPDSKKARRQALTAALSAHKLCIVHKFNKQIVGLLFF